MEFAAELQASLREFTLAAACARIELPRSDLWRSHHSSQELLRHRRAPSPALDAQLAVELYEHDPALNILEKIDLRRAGNRNTWLVPQREPETLLNHFTGATGCKPATAGRGLLVACSPAVAERRDRSLWLFSRGRRAAEFSGIHSQREQLRLPSVENGPCKGEKRLGHCPNRLPGCVLEVVLMD